jgi:flavin prenyltransferase
VPAFYVRPRTLKEMVDHTVGRLLDLFGLEVGLAKRWGEGGPDDPRRRFRSDG